ARAALDDGDCWLLSAASDRVRQTPARAETDDRRLAARPLHQLRRLVARTAAVPLQRLLALATEHPVDGDRADGRGDGRVPGAITRDPMAFRPPVDSLAEARHGRIDDEENGHRDGDQQEPEARSVAPNPAAD